MNAPHIRGLQLIVDGEDNRIVQQACGQHDAWPVIDTEGICTGGMIYARNGFDPYDWPTRLYCVRWDYERGVFVVTDEGENPDALMEGKPDEH